MKFSVDAQLPGRLARELNVRDHDAIHTLDLPNRNASTDGEITSAADRDGRIVVSKDADFRDSHLSGVCQGGCCLSVRTGNIRNADLLGLASRVHGVADLVRSSKRWPYVSSVMVADAWPSLVLSRS